MNTSLMNCQTHKTAYGQITILPSHSLLVDFRESQRRRGLKGDEVFVVGSDGLSVSRIDQELIDPNKVYSSLAN